MTDASRIQHSHVAPQRLRAVRAWDARECNEVRPVNLTGAMLTCQVSGRRSAC